MFPDGSWRPATAQDSVYSIAGKSEKGVSTAGKEMTVAETWKLLSEEILNQSKRIQSQFREATNAQFKASQAYNSANRQKNTPKEKLEPLKDAYDSSVAKLKNLKQSQVDLKKIIQKMRKWAYPSSKITSSRYNQLLNIYQKHLVKYDQPKSPFASMETKKSGTQKETPKKEIQKTTSNEVAQSSPESKSKLTHQPKIQPQENNVGRVEKTDLWSTTPSTDISCTIEIDSVDQMTGLRKLSLPYSMIFFHTDPDLRPFFKNKDLITCRGKLASIGGQYYLQVQFEIASANSQNNFGGLAQGSLLRIKLLNGELVSIYNTKADLGKINSYSGNTLFTGTYPLSRDDLKKLSESELDKMRVMWNTGFEDYELIYLDFFKQQIACLQSFSRN